jgi:hypothetical protein
MARYFEMEAFALKWIWNLTYGVGQLRPNRPDDVQLIQHCFNKLMSKIDFQDRAGRPIKSYLKRDGLFGPRTEEAIWAFQTHLKAKPSYIAVDGAADPSDPTGYTKTDNIYTIVQFNRVHLECYGAMMDEKDFPNPLKQTATASVDHRSRR